MPKIINHIKSVLAVFLLLCAPSSAYALLEVDPRIVGVEGDLNVINFADALPFNNLFVGILLLIIMGLFLWIVISLLRSTMGLTIYVQSSILNPVAKQVIKIACGVSIAAVLLICVLFFVILIRSLPIFLP